MGWSSQACSRRSRGNDGLPLSQRGSPRKAPPGWRSTSKRTCSGRQRPATGSRTRTWGAGGPAGSKGSGASRSAKAIGPKAAAPIGLGGACTGIGKGNSLRGSNSNGVKGRGRAGGRAGASGSEGRGRDALRLGTVGIRAMGVGATGLAGSRASTRASNAWALSTLRAPQGRRGSAPASSSRQAPNHQRWERRRDRRIRVLLYPNRCISSAGRMPKIAAPDRRPNQCCSAAFVRLPRNP